MNRTTRSNSQHFSALKLLIFGAVFCVMAPKLAAQTKNDTIIRAGIYQNPPKIFMNENGEPGGIFIDILNEIARIEGWKIEYSKHTWNACLKMLENGELDILPDVAVSIERAATFDFNKIPLLESWSQVYVSKKNNVKNFSDLTGYNIAVLEGSVQQEKLRQLMNGLGYPYTEIKTVSMQDAFSAVNIGVADAAIVNHLFGQSHAEKFNLVATPIVFDPALLHFAVSKTKNGWLLQKIDLHLEGWKNERESFYYSTLKKYNGHISPPEKMHSHWLYQTIIALAACAIILFLFILKNQKKLTKLKSRELQAKEEKFGGFIENAPYGVFVANKNAEFTEVNTAASRITGYSETELLSKKITDLIPPAAQPKAMNHFGKVVSEGKASDIIPYLTKHGDEKLWKVDAVKISENVFIGFVSDVTEELKIKSRHTLLGRIFDQSVNEIYVFNPETFRFVEVNKAVVENTGYTPEDFKEMTPLDLKLNLSENEFLEIIQPLEKKEKEQIVFETQHFRKDKSFYETEIHLQIIENDAQRFYLAIVLDISDRKKAGQNLINLKNNLEMQVDEKTRQLNERIAELENFREATIGRELRMEQLRNENKQLKQQLANNKKD